MRIAVILFVLIAAVGASAQNPTAGRNLSDKYIVSPFDVKTIELRIKRGEVLEPAPTKDVRHYVFFNLDRERISEESFLSTKAFAGAQLKYTWRELEPKKDEYNFSQIRKDLAFLTGKGKKLFIQLQDVTFNPQRVFVPNYLRSDEYNGGVAPQYANKHEELEGWVARRWDPLVQERLHKLFAALGKEFDGKIEGINLAETSMVLGGPERTPKGFTHALYRDAVIANMKALKQSFPKFGCDAICQLHAG